MNGVFNLLNIMNYYKIIYNPTEYVFELHPNISNYISYENYMKKNEIIRLIMNNNTLLYDNLFVNKTYAGFVLKDLKEVEGMIGNKIIVHMNNLLIMSLFMIGCAIILFFLRVYRKDWKQDMVPFYMVNLFSYSFDGSFR